MQYTSRMTSRPLGLSQGALCGLSAAALFGLSAPLAKLLLPHVGVLPLASLLYLGAGIGLVGWSLGTRSNAPARESALRRADAVPLVAIVALGGVIGPILMLVGLARVSAVAGALLLNLEGPLTILLAVLLFGEHLGLRGALAAALVFAGAAALAFAPGALRADPLGVLCLAGACASWGVDNNLTQRLSLRDPVALARIKTLGAGLCSGALAWATNTAWPEPGAAALALAVGSVCYGASLVLDTYALRLLGAAREAAFFATAPFVGALAAVPLLGETPRAMQVVAALLMAGGVAVLLRERHGHEHAHDTLEHEHRHVHDAHHQHAHDASVPLVEPHSHPHRHAPLVHDHPHVSDLHHRHSH